MLWTLLSSLLRCCTSYPTTYLSYCCFVYIYDRTKGTRQQQQQHSHVWYELFYTEQTRSKAHVVSGTYVTRDLEATLDGNRKTTTTEASPFHILRPPSFLGNTAATVRHHSPGSSQFPGIAEIPGCSSLGRHNLAATADGRQRVRAFGQEYVRSTTASRPRGADIEIKGTHTRSPCKEHAKRTDRSSSRARVVPAAAALRTAVLLDQHAAYDLQSIRTCWRNDGDSRP